jgi:hypothetical protein
MFETYQQTNIGYNACTHCLDNTESIYLGKSKKVVCLEHRRFLPPRHAVRKKGKHFKGEADPRPKPKHRTGEDILGMVNDLKVIFGKCPGSQSVPNDINGHTHVEEEIYILGATLLEIPRGPLCSKRDARDKESLREPARLLGRVW